MNPDQVSEFLVTYISSSLVSFYNMVIYLAGFDSIWIYTGLLVSLILLTYMKPTFFRGLVLIYYFIAYYLGLCYCISHIPSNICDKEFVESILTVMILGPAILIAAVVGSEGTIITDWFVDWGDKKCIEKEVTKLLW